MIPGGLFLFGGTSGKANPLSLYFIPEGRRINVAEGENFIIAESIKINGELVVDGHVVGIT